MYVYFTKRTSVNTELVNICFSVLSLPFRSSPVLILRTSVQFQAYTLDHAYIRTLLTVRLVVLLTSLG